jgi:hypothetical protein
LQWLRGPHFDITAELQALEAEGQKEEKQSEKKDMKVKFLT